MPQKVEEAIAKVCGNARKRTKAPQHSSKVPPRSAKAPNGKDRTGWQFPAEALKNLRTLSGRVDPSALSYRAYMRITCLEMEKVRRNAERNSAAQRIREIDARLREIDQEKRELLEAIHAGPKASSRLPGIEVKPSSYKRAAGFRIRY